MIEQDRWLNQMPHKPLVWHELYDLMRRFDKTDTDVACNIELAVNKRIKAIEALRDESPEVLAKLKEIKAWLEERLT